MSYKLADVFNSQTKYTNNKTLKGFDFIFKKPYFLKLTKPQEEFSRVVFRPIQNPESSENPILIFGCSYAYGYVFDNTETISYIMSKYSKRPVINRAATSWGIQHMLYQLKNDKSFFSSIKKPKYIFYVLMEKNSHFLRMYLTCFNVHDPRFYLSYKLKDGNLTENKPLFNLYYNFALPRHIYNKLIQEKITKKLFYGKREPFDLFIIHCKEINDLIKEYWGNDTKFIILTFEYTKKEMWAPQLNEMGIDVIDIAETIGYEDIENPKNKFFEPEICAHPNRKVWELLIPKLKEKYPDL